MTTKFTFEQLTEFFEYLDNLRESGVTNMWGAGAYLQGVFGLDRKDANAVLGLWMRTFGKGVKPAEDRAADALEGYDDATKAERRAYGRPENA